MVSEGSRASVSPIKNTALSIFTGFIEHRCSSQRVKGEENKANTPILFLQGEFQLVIKLVLLADGI